MQTYIPRYIHTYLPTYIPTGETSDNFDGAGVGDCSFSSQCTDDEESTEPSASAYSVNHDTEHMWHAQGANTTVGILDLKATYTALGGSGGPPPSNDDVLNALSSTISDLGLPSRFKLRVEKAQPLSPYDDFHTGGAADDDAGGATMMSTGDCGMTISYKAYFVSDKQDVTHTLIKGLKKPANGKEVFFSVLT